MTNDEDKQVTRRLTNDAGDELGWMIFCPACKRGHNFDGRWTFNGNVEKPTFMPSMLVNRDRWEPPVTPENMDEWERKPWEQTKVTKICHSFVTDGQIQFLGDCTHELAGKTVPLEPF